MIHYGILLLATNSLLLESREAILAPPKHSRLNAGAIQPRGWLKDQAELQANGMTGALGYYGGGISASMWWPGNGEKSNGEEQGGGYYINGMFPLSCQGDFPRLRARRDAGVKHIVNFTTDGFLGPPIVKNVSGSLHDDSYWGRMSLVLGLQAFCECEGLVRNQETPFLPRICSGTLMSRCGTGAPVACCSCFLLTYALRMTWHWKAVRTACRAPATAGGCSGKGM